MQTILIDTALMMGITFVIGFIVAALMKLVTKLLSFTQENSLKDIFKIWHHHARLSLFKRLRIEAISKKMEDGFEVFDYSLSPNIKNKKHSSGDTAGFPDYPVSHNKAEE